LNTSTGKIIPTLSHFGSKAPNDFSYTENLEAISFHIEQVEILSKNGDQKNANKHRISIIKFEKANNKLNKTIPHYKDLLVDLN
jgi:hypothetical protein